jgi:hypothetical protein
MLPAELAGDVIDQRDCQAFRVTAQKVTDGVLAAAGLFPGRLLALDVSLGGTLVRAHSVRDPSLVNVAGQIFTLGAAIQACFHV